MNEKTADGANTYELALDQLRILGDLLSCLEAAGYDSEEARQLQLTLAARLHSQAGRSLPGPEEGDQAMRPAPPDEALLDSLDTAALIARSSLGTPSARRIRSLTSASQIAEILRRRDQLAASGQQSLADPAKAGATETASNAAVPAGDQDLRSAADTHPRRPRGRFRIPSIRRNLLTTFSGARAEILRQDPAERPRFRRQGWVILLTSGMAAVSMWFAVSTVIGATPFTALLAALMGLIVAILNRWLFTSLTVEGGRRWGSAIPRLLIAALLGILISTPIALRVFQPEINAQITAIKADEGPQVSHWNAVVADLQKVVASDGNAPLSPSADPRIKSLTKQLKAAQSSERQAYEKWLCELHGGHCAGTSGIAGDGAIAQADAKAYAQAQARVAALTNEIRQREILLTATNAITELERHRVYQLTSGVLVAAHEQLNAARAQQNEAANGLLVRLRALNQLAGKGITLPAGLLFLFFIWIECLPVTVKLLERPRTDEKLQQAETERELDVAAVESGQTPTPPQILGELLTGHPKAASLQAEASHCQALARSSAANVGQKFIAAQAARLSYEELRHRLDPRRRHTIHFGAGLLLLIVLGAGLTVLDAIELRGLLGGMGSVLPALAATAVWLTGAWLAALASRERPWALVLATIGAAILLGLLLAALHRSWVFGVLIGVFILVLVVGAAVFIGHTESASLFLVRRRWHRARAAHQAAVQIEQEDVGAAAAATEAWLGLVRTQASAVAGDEEHLVHETVTLAAALLENRSAATPPVFRHA